MHISESGGIEKRHFPASDPEFYRRGLEMREIPARRYAVYEGPFKFENGTVKAVSIVGDECGEICSKRIGYDRSSWKMTINPYNTLVDCGEVIEVTGFNFIPNRNNFHGDYVSKGTMSISLDGKKWNKVADFEFGNIINDPTLRYVGLAAPAEARYLRLDVLELVGDGDGFQSVDSDIEVL